MYEYISERLDQSCVAMFMIQKPRRGTTSRYRSCGQMRAFTVVMTANMTQWEEILVRVVKAIGKRFARMRGAFSRCTDSYECKIYWLGKVTTAYQNFNCCDSTLTCGNWSVRQAYGNVNTRSRCQTCTSSWYKNLTMFITEEKRRLPYSCSQLMYTVKVHVHVHGLTISPYECGNDK